MLLWKMKEVNDIFAMDIINATDARKEWSAVMERFKTGRLWHTILNKQLQVTKEYFNEKL
jgi:hypothetical protein